MNEINTDIFSQNKFNDFTAKEYLFKYLSYWPLFLVSLIICVEAGRLYTKYATLKYRATALIMVNENKNTDTRTSADLVRNAINGEPVDNLDNELQLFKSISLIDRVVIKNEFNISYYRLGKVKNTDLYLDVPFRLIPQNIKDSSSVQKIVVKRFNNEIVTVAFGQDNTARTATFKWNSPFKINNNEFVLAPRGKLVNGDGNYLAVWNPVNETSKEILSKYEATMLDKKTSFIQLSILIENLKRGEDILNAIIREFIQTDIDDKNTVSHNTIRFIDDRLDIVSGELSGVESNLENFQGSNELINVANQTTQSFANSNDVSKNITDINIQLGVVEMIQSYLNNPNNQGKLVPSSLSISDATLANLLNRYNELELNKERQAPSLAGNSIVLKDLNNQINDVKGSILESLQNITKNLKLQENSLQQKNQQYTQFLSSLPHKERVMQEIKRKQSITEGLYLYLLQKREETAISASTSSISLYKQMDSAQGEGPVQPNVMNIIGYSVVLGLLFPIGLIRLRSLLNDKITSRNEVTAKLNLPVLGEITHLSKRASKGIVVMDRNLVSEQFRILRTNLSFLQKNEDKQVLLVTSSSIGEGKSFVSLNTAAVLAIPGKKVALLEFDLRSPGIIDNINMESDSKGISNYLNGQTDNLIDIYQEMPNIPSLHVYPAGPVPDNAADVLLSENIPKLLEALKKQYDYIVIDTAPAGMVTDAYVLAEYSDAVIFVVRLEQTLKKQLDFINDVYKAKKLINIGIVINDVRTGSKHGYGYGYGKGNNYNFKKVTKKPLIKSVTPVNNE
jgi:capsular exopolysaccharide synthesis family protein